MLSSCEDMRVDGRWISGHGGVQIRKWMREAGLRTWQDGVGNVHGRIDGRNRDAPALLCGSHYDTVVDAGKYDGALGIIVAIAAVKATILQVKQLVTEHCSPITSSGVRCAPLTLLESSKWSAYAACCLWGRVIADRGCNMQAASATRVMMPEEVRAAVRESADLGQWLGNKVHNLFSTPMEVIAFSDEEGVRWRSEAFPFQLRFHFHYLDDVPT
jgi:allantoate deiminase